MVLFREANAPACALPGAGVGGHDQDDVAEIRLAAIGIGQFAVIHHLQQDIENIRVSLLHFIQQQHRVGVFGHRLGQQASLVEADIAGRRPHQL